MISSNGRRQSRRPKSHVNYTIRHESRDRAVGLATEGYLALSSLRLTAVTMMQSWFMTQNPSDSFLAMRGFSTSRNARIAIDPYGTKIELAVLTVKALTVERAQGSFTLTTFAYCTKAYMALPILRPHSPLKGGWYSLLACLEKIAQVHPTVHTLIAPLLPHPLLPASQRQLSVRTTSKDAIWWRENLAGEVKEWCF